MSIQSEYQSLPADSLYLLKWIALCIDAVAENPLHTQEVTGWNLKEKSSSKMLVNHINEAVHSRNSSERDLQL